MTAARPLTLAVALVAAGAIAPVAQAAQTFQSRKDIAPPSVRVTTKAKSTAPGLIFVAPKGGPKDQRGSMIFDETGELVYFRKVPTSQAVLDFRVQTYKDQPVLTWWEGKPFRGWGEGKAMIVDQGYRKIAEVETGRGYKMDFHEFQLTDRGTALVLAYKIYRQDLRSVPKGKRRSLTMQNIVQEIDVKTGKVLFHWDGNKHIAPRESYDVVPDRPGFPYDYIHANSVREDTDGNLLLSARATHAVYKINRKTGKIMWRLGGKRSDFKMGKGARFRFQHDAERQPDGTITLYDNNADEPVPNRVSRGIRLRLNMGAKRATLVRQWKYPKPLLAASQGNMQTLPNNNVFVGWGGFIPNINEFSRGGAVQWEARFTSKLVDTYRAYKFPWTGQPTTAPPRAVASRSGDTITSYVSWNGATTVASWRILGGPAAAALVPRATVPRTGFETRLRYTGTDAVVAVEALDAQGNVLSRSRTVNVSS